jgi:hypothetical protein
MKATKFTLLLLIVAFVSSCGTFKPAAKFNTNYAAESGSSNGIRFLNVKGVEHSKTFTSQVSNTETIQIATDKKSSTIKPKGGDQSNTEFAGNYSSLQIKYAEKLGVNPSEIKNIKLYKAIESWYGTRYCFGGTSKRGVDCSSLMQHLYKEAYGKAIPRTAVTQHGASERITQDELKEGDLVFFHTTRSGISHVGFYLGNRKFIHASSSRGVVISSLDESYYLPRYRGAGRFKKEYEHDGEEEGEETEMEGTK